MQRLLKAQHVKELIDLSVPTIYRLHNEGILPGVEIARRKRKRILRWRPETVEAFIMDREKVAPK